MSIFFQACQKCVLLAGERIIPQRLVRRRGSGHVDPQGYAYAEDHDAIREPSQVAWLKIVWAHALLLARKIPVYFCQGVLGDRHAARVQFGDGGTDCVDLIVGVMLGIVA